jgi:hypothetical protein
MSKKNTIRLTESDLKRVITESVKKVLRESEDNPFAWDGKYADGGSDMNYDEVNDLGRELLNTWGNFAKSLVRSGFIQENRALVEKWYNSQNPLHQLTEQIVEMTTIYE